MDKNEGVEQIVRAMLSLFAALNGFGLKRLLDYPLPDVGFAAFVVALLLVLRFLTGASTHLWYEHVRKGRSLHPRSALQFVIDLGFLIVFGILASAMCYAETSGRFLFLALFLPLSAVGWYVVETLGLKAILFHDQRRLAEARDSHLRAEAALRRLDFRSADYAEAKARCETATTQLEKAKRTPGEPGIEGPWEFWWKQDLLHAGVLGIALWLHAGDIGRGLPAWGVPLGVSWWLVLGGSFVILVWDLTQQLRVLTARNV